jgi:hypothetical protein
MVVKELETQKLSKQWIADLDEVIDILNNRVNDMTKLRPYVAIKRKNVKQKETVHDKEDAYKFHERGTKVRYLLEKDEVLDTSTGKTKIERKRATDPLWSKDIYTVGNIVKSCEDCIVMHWLEDDKGKPLQHLYNYWELKPQ